MSGTGNGWAAGPRGTELWGRFGAAGLLVFTRQTVLLQHRAAWTSQGGTWALPGGARDPEETPEMAAVREAWEETGLRENSYEIVDVLRTSGPFPADPKRPELPGGWTYTTVLAFSESELPTEANEESLALCWVPFDQVENYSLLPAFGLAWPRLKAEITKYLQNN